MLKHQSFSSNLCHSTHLNQNELIFGRACNLNPSPLTTPPSSAATLQQGALQTMPASATQPSCMPRANITYLCLVVANNFCRRPSSLSRAVAPAVNDTTANKVHTHTHTHTDIHSDQAGGQRGVACCVMAKLISFAGKQVLKAAVRRAAV